MGQGSSLFRSRKVTGAGSGLVSRAGLVVMGEVMDATGMTSGFRDAFSAWPRRRHDPGERFAQAVLGLADGAKAMTDVTAVARDCGLYRSAASNTAMSDWFNRIASTELAGIAAARAKARERAWAAGAGPKGSTLIIDIDATIISAIDTKEDTGPYRKGGYGFYPLTASAPELGKMLDLLLRPGNAGSNTAEDHVVLLDRVLENLPARWHHGHNPGDTSAETTIVVRADTAGATGWFIEHCIDRNLEFSFGYPIDDRVRAGLLLAQEEHWTPARDRHGRSRKGSYILEITHLVETNHPPGTRVVARRERPHPGAQLLVFDDINGWRHQVFITNSSGRPVSNDATAKEAPPKLSSAISKPVVPPTSPSATSCRTRPGSPLPCAPSKSSSGHEPSA